MKTQTSLSTQNFSDLSAPTGNIYKSIVVIAKRAKQVAFKAKEELDEKLADFIFQTDNLEEVFENKEHIEISKSYEKQPKPIIIAIQEFLAGDLSFRAPEPIEE